MDDYYADFVPEPEDDDRDDQDRRIERGEYDADIEAGGRHR